jgi:CRISPR-associated protein Csm3
MSLKLETIYEIKATIELKSGLHIGGDSGEIEIGGNDNPVIRDKFTKKVYIPGSSIKGKMRFLTEWYEGKICPKGEVYTRAKEKDKLDLLLNVFGTVSNISTEEKKGPTRLTVKDAFLLDESIQKLEELITKTGYDTEMKYENTINRIDSKANPRNMERVPMGTKFEINMNYKVFSMDKKEEIEEMILKSLRLLEIEGIGGGVSRGSGQIKISELKITNLFDKSVEE